jgi:hypothetical protein
MWRVLTLTCIWIVEATHMSWIWRGNEVVPEKVNKGAASRNT